MTGVPTEEQREARLWELKLWLDHRYNKDGDMTYIEVGNALCTLIELERTHRAGEGSEAGAVSGLTFNEAERRVLLDLIDEENARDRRTYVAGRTTREVWDTQDAMYWGLRRKLVSISPTEDSVPG